MKKNIWNLILLAVVVTFTACGGKQGTEKPADDNQPKTNCTFSYDGANDQCAWTAYKFTEKAGVSGVFKNVQIEGTATSENITEVFKSANFMVDISSIDSKDPGRDTKLKENFFGTMANTMMMTGKVKEMTGDNSKGKCVFTMTMNEKEADVEATYTVKEGVLVLDADIDLAKWDAIPAVEALNKVCADLHTGKDGVSKLWSEVNIRLETTLKKECKD